MNFKKCLLSCNSFDIISSGILCSPRPEICASEGDSQGDHEVKSLEVDSQIFQDSLRHERHSLGVCAPFEMQECGIVTQLAGYETKPCSDCLVQLFDSTWNQEINFEG